MATFSTENLLETIPQMIYAFMQQCSQCLETCRHFGITDESHGRCYNKNALIQGSFSSLHDV